MSDEPFDPTDPYQAACERFRKGVLDLALQACRTEGYAAMPTDKQLSALMLGALTGVIGAGWSYVEGPGSREMIVQALLQSIGPAVEHARTIEDEDERGPLN